MVKPWDQYAQQAPESGASKPWEKYGAAPAEAVQSEQPAPERGLMDRLGAMLTGSDRQTRATQELPELQNSGVLHGLDIPAPKAAALSAALVTMTNPEEIAQTLRSVSPDLDISQDEKGNIMVSNNKTGARAVINKPGVSGLDVAQGVGIGAAFAPSGRVANAVGGGMLRQAATLGVGSALTQAAIEGGQQAAGGEFNGGDVAAAGAMGAASPIIGGALGAGVDLAKRGAAALRTAPGGESQIVQAAARENIPLMTSDISPPNTPIGQLAQRAGERIPLAGTGGLRATQQEARRSAIEKLGADFPEPKPDEIVSSLKRQTGRIKEAAGKRYEELIPRIDSAGPVAPTNTSKAIDDALSNLKKAGVLSSDDAVRELESFRSVLSSTPQTYSMLKENRTALRDIVSAYDSPGRSQLPSRAKAMLNNVYSALTRDMDDAAKTTLGDRDFSRLKEANAIYAQEAEKLTKTRLKTLLDKGDYTPEVADYMLFSKKPSEVRSLYQSLDTQGKQAAKASVIQRAISKAGGIDNISPDKFLNELNRLQAHTGIVFKGDERRQIEGLREVLAATKRAGQTGITNTGQEAFVPVSAAAAGSALGSFGGTLAAFGTAGGLARVYESPAVRNALIRIGQAPKSEEGKQLALRVAREINAGIQSARSQRPEESRK